MRPRGSLSGDSTHEIDETEGGQIVDDVPVDANYDHLLEHVGW